MVDSAQEGYDDGKKHREGSVHNICDGIVFS